MKIGITGRLKQKLEALCDLVGPSRAVVIALDRRALRRCLGILPLSQGTSVSELEAFLLQRIRDARDLFVCRGVWPARESVFQLVARSLSADPHGAALVGRLIEAAHDENDGAAEGRPGPSSLTELLNALQRAF